MQLGAVLARALTPAEGLAGSSVPLHSELPPCAGRGEPGSRIHRATAQGARVGPHRTARIVSRDGAGVILHTAAGVPLRGAPRGSEGAPTKISGASPQPSPTASSTPRAPRVQLALIAMRYPFISKE